MSGHIAINAEYGIQFWNTDSNIIIYIYLYSILL